MFTGLIEEVGIIGGIQSVSKGKSLLIQARRIQGDLQVNDSIAVNGVCLTATRVLKDAFEVTAVEESLQTSTLGRLDKGAPVNLERALTLNDRLGGHLVQGHVDGVGTLVSIQSQGVETRITVQLPDHLMLYTIVKGSIALDGISLTIADISGSRIRVSVIPHTWQNTTLQKASMGSEMNVEVDFFAKYIEKFLRRDRPDEPMDEAWLRSQGY